MYNSRLKSTRKIIITLFALGFASLVYGQQANFGLGPDNDKIRPELQKEARKYRSQALELQRIGDLEGASALYQKAVELDPSYAVAYNDLGVIYEAKGLTDLAEECYLESIRIDPDYLSAYSNLALLYENKRELKKAAYYWKKRAELGSPGDPWTEKARKRLEDINLVLSDKPQEYTREQEVVGLLKDVANKKAAVKKAMLKKGAFKKDNKDLAREHFEKAIRQLEKQDYATAIKEALDAQQLDPSNQEIERFIEKVQTRALSR